MELNEFGLKRFLNLYLVSRMDITQPKQFCQLVVAAETEDIAKTIHPALKDSWTTDSKHLHIKLIGLAEEYMTTGIVLGAYHKLENIRQ